jgi:hypothetical protein
MDLLSAAAIVFVAVLAAVAIVAVLVWVAIKLS